MLVHNIVVVIVELFVGHGSALVDVEPLVPFHAVFVAILHNLALADGSQDVLVVAPLALANHQLLALLELEGEWLAGILSVLNNDVLVLVQINLMHTEGSVQEGLHRLAWEFDSTIDLRDNLAACLSLFLGALSGSFVPVSYLLARVEEVLFVRCGIVGVVEPEPDVINAEVEAGRVERVSKSPLEVLQISLGADLGPPPLEHGLIVVTSVQLLAVQKADLELV